LKMLAPDFLNVSFETRRSLKFLEHANSDPPIQVAYWRFVISWI